MTPNGILTEAQLVEAAECPHEPTVLGGLESIIGNGFADEVLGVEGSEPKNAARVGNWIVWTDSQGNSEPESFETEALAEAAMEQRWGERSIGGHVPPSGGRLPE